MAESIDMPTNARARRNSLIKNLTLAVGLLIPIRTSAQPVVTVLSSETGPYREASAGFQQGFGATVPSFVLNQGEPKIPDSTRVVVAFGSKAALKSYSDRITLIYVMSPGTVVQTNEAVKICMEPGAQNLINNLKNIYPGVKKLGVLWASPRFKEYASQLREAAEPANILVETAVLKDSGEIADHLRKLYGKVDAIWLPPDPLLLNATSLSVFMEFSRSNKIPLFVPTGGLVEQGATASIGPTFREMGRAAGIAARKVLEGERQGSKIYPANVEIIVNKTVAMQVGLRIPDDVLRKADKVLP